MVCRQSARSATLSGTRLIRFTYANVDPYTCSETISKMLGGL